MESRTSNFSAQIYRYGRPSLRYARSALYVNAQHAPPLKQSLIRHPQHFLIVCGQICVKYPEDKYYMTFDDSARYFDPDFRFRRLH